MGAWGNGPFDNDDAADFLGELGAVGDADAVSVVLGDALKAVINNDDYIEAPEMSRAIAAAAVVALFTGEQMPTTEALPETWLGDIALEPPAALRAAAAAGFRRAFDPENNEWYALWDEVELVEEVRELLQPYSTAVKG
jgi:hypothetical protein